MFAAARPYHESCGPMPRWEPCGVPDGGLPSPAIDSERPDSEPRSAPAAGMPSLARLKLALASRWAPHGLCRGRSAQPCFPRAARCAGAVRFSFGEPELAAPQWPRVPPRQRYSGPQCPRNVFYRPPRCELWLGQISLHLSLCSTQEISQELLLAWPQVPTSPGPRGARLGSYVKRCRLRRACRVVLTQPLFLRNGRGFIDMLQQYQLMGAGGVCAPRHARNSALPAPTPEGAPATVCLEERSVYPIPIPPHSLREVRFLQSWG